MELVTEDPLFQEFISNRNLSEGSIRLYRIALQQYSNFCGKTLKELIDEAEMEEDAGIRIRKRKIKERLNNFKLDLIKKEYAQNTINTTVNRVRSFYNEFELQLPRTLKRKARKDKKLDSFTDLPTIEDIQHILSYANPTYRVIILLGFSSGMSRSELLNLTFKHYYDAIPLTKYPKTLEELIDRVGELDDIVPLWRITRVKTGNDYFTFSSPEASDAILNYLKDLQVRFPDYNPKPEDHLLRNKTNTKVHTRTLTEMMHRLNEKAGFKKVNNRYYINPHILRKVFASTLERNKMPHLMTREMLGHTIDSVTGAYFKADPQAVKEEYITVLDQLTTNKVEIKVVNQYEDLSEKLDQKDIEIQKLKSELKPFKEFQKRVENLEDNYGNSPSPNVHAMNAVVASLDGYNKHEGKIKKSLKKKKNYKTK